MVRPRLSVPISLKTVGSVPISLKAVYSVPASTRAVCSVPIKRRAICRMSDQRRRQPDRGSRDVCHHAIDRSKHCVVSPTPTPVASDVMTGCCVSGASFPVFCYYPSSFTLPSLRVILVVSLHPVPTSPLSLLLTAQQWGGGGSIVAGCVLLRSACHGKVR